MDALFGIMSAFGLSASAGLNAYIPLLVVGVIAHYTNWIKLTPPYDLLANPWILILVGVLLIIEMLADKIPAVNHINDIIQTVFRPAAGAIVFAASAHALTGVHPVLALACGLLVAGRHPYGQIRRDPPGRHRHNRRGSQCAGQHRRGCDCDGTLHPFDCHPDPGRRFPGYSRSIDHLVVLAACQPETPGRFISSNRR